MAKKWVVPCKVCGTPIEYSDTSHQRMKEHGHSRPEYCKYHQPIHRKWKSSMGVSYFDLAPLPGADLTTMQGGWLGSVYHPPRKHEAVVFTPGFDENRFGLTRQKVFEIYEWLKDPEHQVVVVVGPTGSGKSTALPYWLMNPPDEVGEKDFFTRRGQILITQPRILATEKIAKYLGEQLIGSGIGAGLDVGFRHSKLPNADRMNTIVFETDGTLINLIQRGGLSDLSLITRTSNFSSSVQRSTPRSSSTFLAGIPPKLSIWKGRGSSATKCSLPRVKTPCLWRIWPDRESLWFGL